MLLFVWLICLQFQSGLAYLKYEHRIVSHLPKDYVVLWMNQVADLFPLHLQNRTNDLYISYYKETGSRGSSHGENSIFVKCDSTSMDNSFCFDDNIQAFRLSSYYEARAFPGFQAVIKFSNKTLKSGSNALEIKLSTVDDAAAASHSVDRLLKHCAPVFSDMVTGYGGSGNIMLNVCPQHWEKTVVLYDIRIKVSSTQHQNKSLVMKLFYGTKIITSIFFTNSTEIVLDYMIRDPRVNVTLFMKDVVENSVEVRARYYIMEDMCNLEGCLATYVDFYMATKNNTNNTRLSTKPLEVKTYKKCLDSDIVGINVTPYPVARGSSFRIECALPWFPLPHSGFTLQQRGKNGVYKDYYQSPGSRMFIYGQYRLYRCQVKVLSHAWSLFSKPISIDYNDELVAYISFKIFDNCTQCDPKDQYFEDTIHSQITSTVNRVYQETPSLSFRTWDNVSMVISFRIRKKNDLLKEISCVQWVQEMSKIISGNSIPEIYGVEINTPRTCFPTTTYSANKIYVYKWPIVEEGRYYKQKCMNDDNNQVSIFCSLDPYDDLYASFVFFDDTSCSHNASKDLETLKERKVTETNANETADRLSDITMEFIQGPFPEDFTIIHYLVTLEEKLLPFVLYLREDVFFFLIDYLLGMPRPLLEMSQEHYNTSERILSIIGSLGEIVASTSENAVSFNYPNFALVGSSINVTSISVDLFIKASHGNNTILIQEGNKMEAGWSGNEITSFLLTKQTFGAFQHKKNFSSTVAVVSVVYKESKLFSRIKNLEHRHETIDSHVMSVEIRRHHLVDMTPPAIIKFESINGSQTGRKCRFWDESTAMWSTEGMALLNSDPNVTTCTSSHLTNFAVFLTGKVTGSPQDKKALSILTYVGLAITLLGASITIITYSIFPKLRENAQPKILINLCLALILLSLTFMYGGLRLTNEVIECKIIAFLLQYFLLCVFSWSLVEAFHVSRGILFPLKVRINKFMRKTLVISWGIPLLFTGITFYVWMTDYGSEDVCFIGPSTALYVGVISPIMLVMFLNSLALTVIMRVLSKKTRPKRALRESEKTQLLRRIRIILIFCVIFCLTWVVGIPLLFTSNSILMYIFCAVNTLQGFYIFIAYCVRNKQVRLYWRLLLRSRSIRKVEMEVKQINTQSRNRANETRPKSSSRL